jgi:hypothetical protein
MYRRREAVAHDQTPARSADIRRTLITFRLLDISGISAPMIRAPIDMGPRNGGKGCSHTSEKR